MSDETKKKVEAPACGCARPELTEPEATAAKKAPHMKVVIVGGVAGGASCAARLRRLDEKAEIIMVERGPYVSYANCGLPYHVGGVIEKESSLMVANEKSFRTMFAIDARTDARQSGSRLRRRPWICEMWKPAR